MSAPEAPGSTKAAPKVNGWCRDGLHLWCPNKSGRYGRLPCACPCHDGWPVPVSPKSPKRPGL